MFVRWLQTFRLGLKSLLLHKLRSGLAVLGILIGVTAVIWLVAMGEGVSHQAQEQIKELGAKNIIIRSVKPPMESSSSNSSFFVNYGLLRDDYERIVKNVPTVRQAVPLRELLKEARYQEFACGIRLVGCTTEYLTMNNLRMAHGRFLTDRDNDRRDNVCVLAYEVARTLFPYEDPIGKNVQIDRDFYVVIGITKSREATAGIGGSFSGQDFNQDIYIPLSTLRTRIGDQVVTSRGGSREGEVVELSQITVTVGDIDEVDRTADAIKLLLEKYHRQPDYAVVVPKELLRQAEVTRIMFNVLLILIAGIALLVGGIGIMNIMLATVTERTREIGIRRALGAKQRDIVEQFLTETIMLSATGGMLGVIFGCGCHPFVVGVRRLLEQFMPDVMSTLPSNVRNLEPRIALWSIIAAFLISVGVGVVFGLYP
ncbi:MAG TPA: ABC transporter permease, partial [Pirellulales bacterium]|nr:ABC transporter permease [Pirellulales bacterium]